MGSFISIIVNAEKSLNADKSDGAELNSWMLLLLRFRKYLLVNYMFDDIIYRFRGFFMVEKNKNNDLLFDMCFGLKPIKF